jgi:hypothetical protein
LPYNGGSSPDERGRKHCSKISPGKEIFSSSVFYLIILGQSFLGNFYWRIQGEKSSKNYLPTKLDISLQKPKL